MSFNGRTPGFDPGNDGSEPSDGASVFSLFFPFLSARVRGGSNGDICRALDAARLKGPEGRALHAVQLLTVERHYTENAVVCPARRSEGIPANAEVWRAARPKAAKHAVILVCSSGALISPLYTSWAKPTPAP